jgi:hypothetical protein
MAGTRFQFQWHPKPLALLFGGNDNDDLLFCMPKELKSTQQKNAKIIQ